MNCSYTFQPTHEPQNISSPGYPLSYTNNLNCAWNLTARHEFYIRLDLIDFDTEAQFDIFSVSLYGLIALLLGLSFSIALVSNKCL